MSGIAELAMAMTKGSKARVTANKYIIEITKNFNNGIKMNIITSFEMGGDENWLILDDEKIIQPNEINQPFSKGYYKMVYEDLSKTDIKHILSSKVLTIHAKKINTDKYLDHNIPLKNFEVGYQEFIKHL